MIITTRGPLTRVEALLGKSVESISCRELLEVMRVLSESTYVEIKGCFESWRELKDAVMESVVGFLNGPGEGLLVLGYDERKREPVPIPPEVLQLDARASSQDVENKLRDTIIGELESIPPLDPYAFPDLKIKVWRADECGYQARGYTILVYAAKRSDSLYYYDANAYIREGCRTRRLSIEEMFRIVESKSRPILVLLAARPIPQPDGSMRVDFVLRNIGSSPAFNVAIIVEIPKHPWAPQPIEGHVLRDSPDVLVLQRTLMAPSWTMPVFPRIDAFIKLSVSVRGGAETLEELLHAEIYNESTWSRESLKLILGRDCFERIELEVLDYRTMSAIYRASWTTQCPTPLRT